LTRRSDEGFRALWLGARALRRWLAREPVDILIAHGGRAVEAAVLARRRRRPIVVWQRILGFPPHLWRPVRRLRWSAIARRVDAAVALTPDLGDELRRLGFKGPVWVIPNFRDPGPFVAVDRDTAAAALRAELDVPETVGLVGFVGHLIAQKRPDRALDVLVAMHGRGERAHMVVAGDGPLRNRFELDVAARDLADFVHVLGHRDDIPQILARDRRLHPHERCRGASRRRDRGADGRLRRRHRPVGGVRNLVDDGETGIVTDTLDPEELAGRVIELLRDPAPPVPARESRAAGARCASRRHGQPAPMRLVSPTSSESAEPVRG
jgi:glycosyltransferase involved in cell wall biosynthesis